jgi:hypothetical protein
MTLPDWIDPLIWSEYLEMRKNIRKPATEYAQKLAIRKLEQIWSEKGQHPSDVLENCILCSWQGIYPIPERFEDRKAEELNRELRAGAGPVTRRIQ